MRITERARLGALTLAQSRAATRLDKAAREASTAQRVARPSDDPVAYGAKIRRDFNLEMLEEHSRTATRALGELEVVQNVLDKGIDLFSRAQAAAVGGANATADASSRRSLAEDVRTMRAELLSIANTRFGDKYIFAGTRTDVMPFEPVTAAYTGNDQTIRVPVLEGVTPPANITGARVFTAAGGRDLFADLDALAVALDANNIDGIRAASAPLQEGHAQLVRSHVEAGFGAERFRTALEVLVDTKAVVVDGLAKEIEGDPAAQITALTIARTAYERTLAVTKQLLSITSG